jgi:hypothetical protein
MERIHNQELPILATDDDGNKRKLITPVEPVNLKSRFRDSECQPSFNVKSVYGDLVVSERIFSSFKA